MAAVTNVCPMGYVTLVQKWDSESNGIIIEAHALGRSDSVLKARNGSNELGRLSRLATSRAVRCAASCPGTTTIAHSSTYPPTRNVFEGGVHRVKGPSTLNRDGASD